MQQLCRQPCGSRRSRRSACHHGTPCVLCVLPRRMLLLGMCCMVLELLKDCNPCTSDHRVVRWRRF